MVCQIQLKFNFLFILTRTHQNKYFFKIIFRPSFVMEPPSKIEFSNSSGGFLDCSSSGNPQPTIDWLSVDGTSIGDVGGIRKILRNGTLVLLPFPAAAYRQDIHNTVYRCVSSNRVGRIISRDVQIRAGKGESEETERIENDSFSLAIVVDALLFFPFFPSILLYIQKISKIITFIEMFTLKHQHDSFLYSSHFPLLYLCVCFFLFLYHPPQP